MSKDPGFIFYPGDYLRDTQCLSEKVQVAYDRIMCEHMRNICISQQQVNFFTKRLSPDEKEEILMILNQIDGGYEIGWVAESIRNRRAYSDSRRKNRKGNDNNICKSYDKHMENENENENYIVLLNKVIEKNKIELTVEFKEVVLLWLKYKSEKRQSYKETGLKNFLIKTLADTGGDAVVLKTMYIYSTSKNYDGLFKEKTNENSTGNNRRDNKRTNDLWR